MLILKNFYPGCIAQSQTSFLNNKNGHMLLISRDQKLLSFEMEVVILAL